MINKSNLLEIINICNIQIIECLQNKELNRYRYLKELLRLYETQLSIIEAE